MIGIRPGVYLWIDGSDFSIGTYQNRNPGRARRIRLCGAVCDGHRLVRVAEQVVWKTKLIFEREVICWAVHTAAKDNSVLLLEILDSITEPIAFDRSPWGISFRIPPDQNVFSRMVDKRNRIAVLVRNAEGRGLITNFDHYINSLFTSEQLLTDSLVSVHRNLLRTANFFVPILSGGRRSPSAIYV